MLDRPNLKNNNQANNSDSDRENGCLNAYSTRLSALAWFPVQMLLIRLVSKVYFEEYLD
ncbi:MAG: hypothetical protein AB4368_18855 [Xenococcaceae cyanobacterium]